MKRILLAVALLLCSGPVALADKQYPVPDYNLASSFRINIKFKSGMLGRASGFAVDKHTVVSAGHVGSAKDADFTLDVFDKDDWHVVRTVKLKLKKTTKDFDEHFANDMAYFKSDEELPFIEFGDDNQKIFDDMAVGDLVYLLGCPLGSTALHIQFGILGTKTSSLDAALGVADVLGAPGNSGCAVYDYKSHKLIGMLVRGSSQDTNIYFVRITELLKFVKKQG
jgi:hypothetical protein